MAPVVPKEGRAERAALGARAAAAAATGGNREETAGEGGAEEVA